jgi:hypothetical protein
MPRIVGINIPTTVGTLAGGSTTTSALTLKSTTGVGTTGADIIFQVGNNGATEAMRINSSGSVGIGITSPLGKLSIKTGTDQLLTFLSGTSVGASDGVALYSSNEANNTNKSLAINCSTFYVAATTTTFTGTIGTPLTASRALATDSSSNLAVSAVTSTELGYLSGVTSAIQTQMNTKAPSISPSFTTPVLGTPASGVLTNCTGTASGLTAGNVTTNANLTGEVTSVGNAATLTNSAVIGKVLTGYTSGAGTVAATDTILQAIQKLNGNKATNANLTGPITSVGNTTSVASQTGTGSNFVMDNGPTLISPILGNASATSLQSTSIYGGTGTTSILNFKPTSGAGTTGADIVFANGTNGGTERVRISHDGKMTLGVGTNSALYVDSTNATLRPSVDNTTALGIVTNFRYSNIYTVNAVTVGSDVRWKNSIEDSVLGLDFIKKLRPVSYKLDVGQNELAKDENGNEYVKSIPGVRRHYGLIAQEVKEALPLDLDFGGWVLGDKNDPDSYQSLRYEQFIAPIIKAIQELVVQNLTLKNRLDAAGI